MVHALRRAQEIVTPRGCVIDLHPTDALATVEAGLTTGHIDAGDAPLRHAAADAAIAAALHERIFVAEGSMVFTFYTYGDTVDELREYVEKNWRNARIGGRTIERTREALGGAPPGTRPRVREEVRITKLRSNLRSVRLPPS
jgi:hypothetical protein